MTAVNGTKLGHYQRTKVTTLGSQHTATNGVNDEDDMKIQEFMMWHTNRVKKGRRDIPVKDLRHIIPTFILRCFAMKEDQPTQKKVKGLWDRPPNGWNSKIPFLDPNNKGDQGKPKKEVLMQMFEYLVKVYRRTGNTAMDLTMGPIQESEVSMEPEDTVEGSPVEVDDDDNNYNWDPLEDCLQRIKQKLQSIQNNLHLSNSDIGVLNVAKDVLFRLFDQLGVTESLMKAHEFECTLDIVKTTNTLPPEHNQKWHEFEVEGTELDNASFIQTLEKQQLLSDENMKELGISTQHNPLVSGQTDEFSSIVLLRDNLDEFLEDDDLLGKKTENENKFAVANTIITEDKNDGKMGELGDDILDGLVRMFNEGDEDNLLDGSPGPDLSDYFTKHLDWGLDTERNESLQQGWKVSEDVHTPSLDHYMSLADHPNVDEVIDDDIAVHSHVRHNSVGSIDSDHTYVQKAEVAMLGYGQILSLASNMCSQVERLTISSLNFDTTEHVERGRKRGYSDADNQLGPKHRRTEDMDTEEDGEQPTYYGGIPVMVEQM